MKDKVAISIDRDLLKDIDSFAKSSLNGSRSQAITYFVRKGMERKQIDTALLLYHRRHLPLALKKIGDKTLLEQQLQFLISNGIRRAYIITGDAPEAEQIIDLTAKIPLHIEVIQKDVPGNARAIFSVRERIYEDILVLSGDILFSGNLESMMTSHFNGHRIATIGMMTRDTPSKYGVCKLDGDLITSFVEKPKNSESHVVNAGLYIFSKKIFNFIDDSIVSIENDLLPKLASLELLFGYFLSGDYKHIT